MSGDNPFGAAARPAVAAPTPEELAKFALNDLGNAYRLARLVGGAVNADGSIDHGRAELLYLRKRGWISFNGRFWDLEAGEEGARRWAHRVAAGLGDQVNHMGDGIPIKERLKFAQGAGSSGSTSAMLAQAASYLSVDLTAFDRDPFMLNVANGTLRFRRREGLPVVLFQAWHDPADRLTRICNAAYDPEAKRPLFDGVVIWAQPRDDNQKFLKHLHGYGITGSTKEQAFFILQGKGGDGKSTIVNAVRDAAGTYSVGAGIETFLDTGLRRGAEASPDLARLAGDSRLVCTAEPPRGAKLASAQIKAFTGGGSVQARELRQGIFEFTPVGKVLLECNGRPTINDTDDGIWRRINILLFEHQLTKDEMDLDLPEKLKAERSGILNWLIEGVLGWMAEGLCVPDSVRAAIEDYRRGSNPFSEWLADRVELDANSKVLSSTLYADYKGWCDENGHERPMTQTTFGRAMGDHQIILCGKDTSGKKLRRGAKLKDKWSAPEDGGGPSGLSPAAPSVVDDVRADEDWMGD